MTTKNGKTQLTDNQLDEIIANISMMRSEWFARVFDTRRNIDDECGYPRSVADITPWHYQDLYDKEPIATRIVEVLSRECWQTQPLIYEEESPTKITPFEIAWDELSQSLRGEQCWFKDEEGSPVWEYVQRADVQSGIGSFGVILLGFDDGLPLGVPVGGALVGNRGMSREVPVLVNNYRVEEITNNWEMGKEVQRIPVEKPTQEQLLGDDSEETKRLAGGSDKKDGTKLLYMRVFPESQVQIVEYESNVHSSRYGQPVRYSITLNNPDSRHSGIGLPLNTIYVHWSRVIHLADNLQSSEIFGRPRLQPVYNKVLDLRKIYGSDAEGYWKNSLMKMILETHPQLGGDVKIDRTGLKDMLENFDNSSQKSMILMGMSAKTVSPAVVDPTSHIDIIIEATCIQLGIPLRIFKGSERGELASSQDDAAWNDRLKYRQHNYLSPRVIVPLINRLIAVGALPEPGGGIANRVVKNARQRGMTVKRYRNGYLVYNANGAEMYIANGGYSIEWPDLTSQTDQEKAAIALQKTQALSAYIAGGVSAMIPELDYMTTILGMDDEEAGSILENAVAQQEKELATPQAPLEETTDEEAKPTDSLPASEVAGEQTEETEEDESVPSVSSLLGNEKLTDQEVYEMYRRDAEGRL